MHPREILSINYRATVHAPGFAGFDSAGIYHQPVFLSEKNPPALGPGSHNPCMGDWITVHDPRNSLSIKPIRRTVERPALTSPEFFDQEGFISYILMLTCDLH
jgi:hypothetical protein